MKILNNIQSIWPNGNNEIPEKVVSITKNFLKQEGIPLLLISIVIITFQFLIFGQQLEAGFAPDDVRAIGHYKDLGDNPLQKYLNVWFNTGPHYANQTFYNGILFNFFGFNYSLYHFVGIIFKVFSIITLYFLIQVVFRNRLLSIIIALIYASHYGAASSLEMVLKTADYLAIAGLNIFFIIFYSYYRNNLKNRLVLFIASLILFISFFIQPIRIFPVLVFIVFLEIIIFLKQRTKETFIKLSVDQFVLFLPPLFLLIFGYSPATGGDMGNLSLITKKLSEGNLQLLFTPFTTLGSFFLYGENLKILSLSRLSNLSAYLHFILIQPTIFFGFLTLIFSFLVSKKPLRFFTLVMLVNFIIEILIFFIVSYALHLPAAIKIHYDPYVFLPATFLGTYVVILSIFIFFEWIKAKSKNNYLTFYLIGALFSLTLIFFHWFFQDYVFIPMGVRGYATVPVIGVSCMLGSLIMLAYSKLKRKINHFASLIFLLLIPFFYLSNNHIQNFIQNNLKTGMRASDQVSIKDQFWSNIQNVDQPCNKLFYFSTKDDYPNGILYSYIFIDQFYPWYKLYSPKRYDEICPITVIANDMDRLSAAYFSSGKEKGFKLKRDLETFAKANDLIEYNYLVDDFYAFNLKDKKITDIKDEILNIIENN